MKYDALTMYYNRRAWKAAEAGQALADAIAAGQAPAHTNSLVQATTESYRHWMWLSAAFAA